MTARQTPEPVPATFLDMQAQIGITKHIGGFEATDELLGLCHVRNAEEVLNVGCGIGVGSAYIARKFGCRVVGVDISERMIGWSRVRAREDGVEDRVTFQAGNVLDLPFEDGRFDLVFAESVLFVLGRLPATGQDLLRTAGGLQVRDGAGANVTNASPVPRTLFEAASVNLLNPNPYLGWALVLGPAFLAAWHESSARAIVLVVAFYGVMVVGLALFILAASAARFLSPKEQRGLGLGSAVILACLGVYQLAVGIHDLVAA